MSRGLQGLADPPAQHQWHAAGQYPPPPALTRTADPMLALGTAGEVPSPQPHARRLPGQQTARPACARPTARRPHLTRDRHSPADHPHRELTGNARSSIPPGRPGRARGLRPTQNGTIGAPRAGQYDQPLSVQIGGSACVLPGFSITQRDAACRRSPMPTVGAVWRDWSVGRRGARYPSMLRARAAGRRRLDRA